jgi:integrase
LFEPLLSQSTSAAAEYLLARQRRIDAGADDADSQTTLDARKKTWRGLIGWFEPTTLLADISQVDIIDFRETRLGDVTAHTVYKLLCELRVFFRWCIERRYLKVNPAEGVDIKYKTKKQDRSLTLEDFQALRAAVAERRRLYLDFAVETGVRPGREIEAVLWGDVDEARCRVHIRGKKTASADRFLPIRKSFAALLAKARGEHGDDEPVVARWSNARRDLAAACKKAGIRHVRPYDLRHTYASWALQGGAPDSHVAKALGHTTTTMVHRVYGHLRPEHLSSVITALPEVQGPELEDEPAQSGVESGANGPGVAQYLPQNRAKTGQNEANTYKNKNPGEVKNLPGSLSFSVPGRGFEPRTRGFSETRVISMTLVLSGFAGVREWRCP